MTNPDSPAPARGVVVTGGGTGIGRAVARAFATRGDRVLVVGRSETTLKETADGYDGIAVLAADITAVDTADLVVTTAVRELGRIDVLVNNAATTEFNSLGTLTEAGVRTEVATNLLAPIFLTQRSLEPLAETKGTVINISSAGCLGVRAMPASGVYAATKVGLDALTRTWAVELAERAIRVVGIAPGLIDTEVAVRAGMPRPAYEEFLAGMVPRIPSGRVGAPEDIAWWAVQLTEPGARYANGAVFAVDGGLSVT